jgi:hypothetical protein
VKKTPEDRHKGSKESPCCHADPARVDGKMEKDKLSPGLTEASGLVRKSDNGVGHKPADDSGPFKTEEVSEIIPPKSEMRHGKYKKKTSKKKSFNPWRELDKASKKSVSRRDLVTGLFRFLPRQDDK